ncbi:MAG: hypothetical protein ACOC0P_06790 [Planctomycetota bacterium]
MKVISGWLTAGMLISLTLAAGVFAIAHYGRHLPARLFPAEQVCDLRIEDKYEIRSVDYSLWKRSRVLIAPGYPRVRLTEAKFGGLSNGFYHHLRRGHGDHLRLTGLDCLCSARTG